MDIQSLVIIDVVGLTPRHVGEATPRLQALAQKQRLLPMEGVVPALTCTAQASLLTGKLPSEHGIVANGWMHRDTMEARLWQQNNRLIQAEPFYETAVRRARARGQEFSTAQLFWWFNQGAKVDLSLTPKPHYGCDGNKVFGVHGSPEGFADQVEAALGKFPFHTFWGPMAGLSCSEWIARAGAWVLEEKKPTLTLIYLPHLDYDLQRYGASCEHLPRLLGEIDRCVGLVLDAAEQVGAIPVIVSEYGIMDVESPVYINRALREAGLLSVRMGPFGEQPDLHESRAFAVCDHQIAHVSVKDPADMDAVFELLSSLEGIESLRSGVDRQELGLDHPRSGQWVALSDARHWFAYPYWLDDRRAPDFARTVDIHRKPGYDPCELFYDPALRAPKLRAGWRLLQKMMGMRYRMDVIGLDASIVKGSHGRPAADPLDGPMILGPGLAAGQDMSMLQFRDYALELMMLGDER